MSFKRVFAYILPVLSIYSIIKYFGIILAILNLDVLSSANTNSYNWSFVTCTHIIHAKVFHEVFIVCKCDLME